MGVDYVLEGSVRKSGNRVRVSAQLIEAATDKHLWADRYDRELDDVFGIQDDITQQIVKALQLTLSRSEQRRINRRGTLDANVHDLYLRAQEQFYQFSPDGIRNAESLLKQCVNIDKNFADAFAWLARVLVFQFISALNLNKKETLQPALKAARQAVSLDNRLPLAHGILGWTLMWHRNIVEAVEHVDTAVSLGGNIAGSYLWHSLVHSSAGNGQQGLQSVERAIEFNPFYTVTDLMAIGIAYFAMERYGEAAVEFERGITRNPNFIFCHILKASALGMSNRLNEAAAAAATAKSMIDSSERYQAIVKDAFFYNDPAIHERYMRGIAAAGM